jgi:non-ribosomal peptide synthetase component F
LIGFFVNMLVMRTDFSANPTFRTILARVRETALGAFANQDLPFDKLVERLYPERQISQTPLFQVAFVLQNTEDKALVLPGLAIRPMLTPTNTAKFDLTLCLWDSATGLHGYFEYATELYDEIAIRRLASQFESLLASVVDHPDTKISELPLGSQSGDQTGPAMPPQWAAARRRQHGKAQVVKT